jgi:transcriptional regulator with XRE-family HTH domain
VRADGSAKTAAVIGNRIKTFRIREGLSRAEVARRIGVDVTAVAGWEAGKYLPRQSHLSTLARLLGTDPAILASERPDRDQHAIQAALIDTITDMPKLLDELLARTQKTLRALRVAQRHSTPAHVQREFRKEISARLLDRTLEVQRVEIFYDLDRLKEVLSNILRYDGFSYHIKSYCPGLKDLAPAMGGYFFDDNEFLIGGYWASVPPHNRPGLRLSGEPFQTYFSRFWDEIWQRGTLLNLRGRHDLSMVRQLAFQLGLDQGKWPEFVESARALDIGDGSPPLI